MQISSLIACVWGQEWSYIVKASKSPTQNARGGLYICRSSSRFWKQQDAWKWALPENEWAAPQCVAHCWGCQTHARKWGSWQWPTRNLLLPPIEDFLDTPFAKRFQYYLHSSHEWRMNTSGWIDQLGLQDLKWNRGLLGRPPPYQGTLAPRYLHFNGSFVNLRVSVDSKRGKPINEEWEIYTVVVCIFKDDLDWEMEWILEEASLNFGWCNGRR